MSKMDDKIEEILRDNPTEGIQAKYNGGYPISKVSQLKSLFAEFGKELIGRDEIIFFDREADGKPVMKQYYVVRENLRETQRQKLKALLGEGK